MTTRGMMTTRLAACSCAQVRVACTGDPVRISICHCLECQRRTGSVFGAQARFPRDQVAITGTTTAYRRGADSGNAIVFHFCPACGSTVYWEPREFPDLIAIAIGMFGDPTFPAPWFSVYERRRHPWVGVPDSVEHLD